MVVLGRDGDLGAYARLSGDGADLDDAVVDLGDLKLEEPADEVGVGAGDHDGRTLALATDGGLVVVRVAHVDDDGLQALVVRVVLARGALVALVGETALVEMGKLGLDALANLDDREVGRGLEHRAGDDVTNALRELLVDLETGGVAHDGADLGLGVLRCDAGGVGRGDVLLVKVEVLAGLLVVGLLLGDELVDVDLAGGVVDGDARAKGKVKDVGVALGERLLQAVEQVQLVDVLLLAERHQRFHHL